MRRPTSLSITASIRTSRLNSVRRASMATGIGTGKDVLSTHATGSEAVRAGGLVAKRDAAALVAGWSTPTTTDPPSISTRSGGTATGHTDRGTTDRPLGPGGPPGAVLVANAVSRCPSASVRRSCAPGSRRRRRLPGLLRDAGELGMDRFGQGRAGDAGPRGSSGRCAVASTVLG
jgi:hypothetical protein